MGEGGGGKDLSGPAKKYFFVNSLYRRLLCNSFPFCTADVHSENSLQEKEKGRGKQPRNTKVKSPTGESSTSSLQETASLEDTGYWYL